MKTMTSEGWILHRKWRGIFLPVKLDIRNFKGGAMLMDQKPPPKRRNGYLLFALPGGDEISECEI